MHSLSIADGSVVWDVEQFFGLPYFEWISQRAVREHVLEYNQRELAVAIMSRNLFRQLKKYFHVVYNMTLQEGDCLQRYCPCMKIWVNVYANSSMAPYYGHHGCKTFIRGKPIRFEFKVWTMASFSCYPYVMKIYAGKETDKNKEPLGLHVVKNGFSFE
ncbi:PiggyBac transposable element-derived protein 3 [Trichinella zimbabwensis]|uniref:PiggyBac transposable element-derived protein 3 n=1 Tax=Trichinella zimbabwensis TaxID=268475 RepID=A0A0V1GW12_9BILA|nr:PiggyBac transposable element-derived protein 3 [Trichinella zimbabwensis]